MSTTRRTRTFATAMTAGILLLAGCSGNSDAESTSTEDGTSVVRINWGGDPSSWAPGASTEPGYMRLPYETLVVLGPDYEVLPNLVTEWEQDAASITLTLREDVTFHDGTAFNAEAVKANLEYIRDNPGQFSGPLQAVASIDVVDEFTARLNLAFPAPTFMSMLTQRNVFIGSPAAIADGSIVDTPVGTGPWAYNPDASQDGTYWAFDRTDDYWGEDVGFDRVVLYGIEDDSAASAALLGDEIDLTDTVTEQRPILEGGNVDFLGYPAGRNNIVFFDRAPGGAFGDVNTRKAVCSAIDVQAQLDLPSSSITATPTQHFVEGDVGYNPDIVGYVDADLAAAQRMLGADTVDVTFATAVFLKQQVEFFADQMNQLDGVNITVQDLPVPEYISTWSSGQYPLGIGANNQITPYDWYATWFAERGFLNPSGYESPEL
ncbi:ABC transporter substrate-binding protein, partial [Microbacterium sp.]|uniref:ABC transporter substrate-binding protein n=1 Tax=Microbacterium sp. TaxID=51671 RepID=UPI003A87D956